MHRSLFLVVIVVATLGTGVGQLMASSTAVTTNAASSVIARYIPGASLVGEGRLRYLFMDIYDARLFAPRGQYDAGKPVALSLHYLRAITGKTIADRTIDEIREQRRYDEVTLAAWHEKIARIFPDVDESTVLTGIKRSSGETVFYRNDERIGIINDARFARAFFDIWLAPETSSPKLRRSLLGIGP